MKKESGHKMAKGGDEKIKEVTQKRHLCDLRMELLNNEINRRVAGIIPSRAFEGISLSELRKEMGEKAEERKKLTELILKLRHSA